MALIAAMGLFVTAALGVLAGSPSQFEANDGDMVAGNSGGTHDWNNVSFFHVVDPSLTTSDDSFTPGQKQDTVCPGVSQNKNPQKDDFTDVSSFSETSRDSSSSQFLHTYLDGSTIRVAANGNASENVELKQGLNGSCGNGLLARTPGDKLVAIDYLNGGTNVNFHVLTWVGSGACSVGNDTAPCWGANVQTLAANSAEGKASQATISSTNNSINGKTLSAGQFAEFGVDLTAAGIIPLPTVGKACTVFPQTLWESRSSGSSFVSSTEDVSIENHAISNCGEIKFIKQTKPRGIDQKFSFTSNLLANSSAGGVACAAGGSAGVASDGSFCLNDAGNAGKTLGSSAAADNSTGNTIDESNLSPGKYTLTEGTEPSGFTFGGVTCTGGSTSTSGQQLTVNLNVGDQVVCVVQNVQKLGALKILKTSIKAAATPLAGAKFTITDPGGSALPGSPFTTDSNGAICVDGLTSLGNYTVRETSPPTGYAIDDTTAHTVNVTATNAKCSDTTFAGQSIKFTDTPLTDLSVHVASEVAGGTSSSVTCTDSATSPNNVGNSPQSGESATVTANGLKPGTYTCKVVVDP